MHCLKLVFLLNSLKKNNRSSLIDRQKSKHSLSLSEKTELARILESMLIFKNYEKNMR